MKYKLFFVYENYKNSDVKIRIEVGLNNISKSIPPFIRNISLDELVDNVSVDQNIIVLLLNNLGQKKPPFYISGIFLSLLKIQNILHLQDTVSFTETQKLGSLKKSINICKLLPEILKTTHVVGEILCGELYITNRLNWKNNIKVRVLYEKAINSFFPRYNDLPFLLSSGEILYRDKEKEDKLLSLLKEGFSEEKMSLNLFSYDIEFLKTLNLNNWKIYIEKASGVKTSLHLKHNQYGISWFSSKEEDINENISDILLQAYLEGRNYKEFEGDILLVNKENILKKDSLAELIYNNNDGLKKLYLKQEEHCYYNIDFLISELKDLFNGTLKNYQLKGVVWLKELRCKKIGCLLADEMGLGKTVQILAHLATIKDQEYPHLIVAPTSLLPNWKHEIERFIPYWVDEIEVQPKIPNSRKKIILVSYDILRLNVTEFEKILFDTIILDEAQIVKNRNTEKYKSINLLKSEHRIILTGTPIENNIDEIWSHFLFLIPEFKLLLDKLKKDDLKKDSIEFITLSSKLLKPFILRRIKANVINDLPDKIEKNIFITLNKEEEIIYKNVRSVFAQAINAGVSGRVNSIALEGLLRLRQACVNPNMLPLSLNKTKIKISSKIETALEYILEFSKEDKKVLVFSQFVEVLNELEKHLDDFCIKKVRLDGTTKNRDIPVQLFQKDKTIIVFLISLRAGGVGLNLTEAERVILLDSWWNPSVEDQAFARAHRIGQKNNVVILRLICRNTVEEKILYLHEKKRKVIDIFEKNEAILSIDDLKGFFLDS